MAGSANGTIHIDNFLCFNYYNAKSQKFLLTYGITFLSKQTCTVCLMDDIIGKIEGCSQIIEF